ncbi:acyl-CoA synthetase [Actinomadura rupiterrae]|uniref:acyl-CoA synthetase n=1 Tax=Actinomadura rupiterrae TaxID=559627 RepID=UPI0020A493B4|nr:acyl-CoA synthetase [Actinomadura rupiterrae]MCP2338352.1 fatty acid CoA ligase FadD36 [Actinomadura rupiterrae]
MVAEIRDAGVVAVHATASLETVVAVVAGLTAGVPLVPLPPDSGPDERAHILRDSGATLILGAHDAAISGPDVPPLIAVDLLRPAKAPHSDPPAEASNGDRPAGALRSAAVPHKQPSTAAADGRSSIAARGGSDSPSAPSGRGATEVADAGGEAVPDAAATALILYTSGTTGAPKGVLISRAAVAAGLDALAEAWGWTADDIVVHGLPLFHVHGLVLGVLGPLRVGSRLVHTGRPTPQAYADAARNGGTLFFGVPTVWSRVARDPEAAAALRDARLLVSGSAPLPVPVFERLAELTGHRPIERYGMTETLITLSARADGERVPGSVGHPLPGVRTRLVAEDGSPVPADGETPGELEVSAPTIFDGYLGRPDATAKSFTADGWFRTGDIAIIDPTGRHRIVGRASTDLIKSGGYRIGAGEVENALLAHPAVREAAVIGVPHEDLGEQVTAFVVAEDGTGEKDLTDFVATRLSAHKRPRVVHLVETLPRNAMGKVVKTQLTR